MKKTKFYQTKTFTVTMIQENFFLITIIHPSRQPTPYNKNYRGRSPDRIISQNFSQNRYS